MSWEQQASYEGSQGGWTPQFAEDYSMFNATPGRLVNGQRPFVDTSTAQALYGNAHAPIITKFWFCNSSYHIPNKHISAATAPQPASRARLSDVSKTPQKSKKRLDDPFSGQTATPPHSIGKGTRKLAPKIFNVPNNTQVRGNGFESSDSSNHHPQLMAQSSTAMDPFGYPMTAPASTPFFASNKAIWDTSMDGMDLDFSTDSAGIFHQGHRGSNSLDWGRSNQMFQESVNLSPQKSSESKAEAEPRKRHRQIASKTSLPITSALPTSLPLLAFSSATATSNSIAMENFPGVVDPGIIYSRPSTGTSRATTSPIRNLEQLEPYQHQVREYTREQEELRRSRSFRESSMGHRIDRRTASSPVKGSARPGPRRSVSESNRDQRRSEPPRFNSGRLSPVKQQRHPNLTSIPESPAALPKVRRDVKLAIGSNGRATVVVDDESVRSLRRTSSQVIDYESEYDSSTDDEPIIIPSRNNSFNLPQQRPPRFDLFDASSSDFRRPSTSTSGYSRSSGQHTSIDEMSEAETVLDEVKLGDAASALRKVVRERRSNQQMSKNGRHLRLYSDTTPRPGRYAEYTSSSNNSPDGATPSSSRSGTTRCICNNAEEDSFMIQW
ncbi:PHD-finger domain-containing protein [Botrytis cinerea]